MSAGLEERLAGTAVLNAIYRHVESTYPEEGCGFVFESPDGELRALPTPNRASELHRRDPSRYPRDGRNYFEPDMGVWLKAERDGLLPRLIFHSHPEVGAYFSETDRQSAVFEDDDGAVFERHPGVDHLVVSVRGSPPEADEAKLFRYRQGAFQEVATFGPRGHLRAAVRSAG